VTSAAKPHVRFLARRNIMKRTTLLLAFLVTSEAYALSATTTGGSVACLSKEWLDDMVNFVVSKDKDNFQAYLDSNKCIIPKEGLTVTVTESPGMFGTKAVFGYRGIKFWTVREGLTDYRP
jgi:hypothetical protein